VFISISFPAALRDFDQKGFRNSAFSSLPVCNWHRELKFEFPLNDQPCESEAIFGLRGGKMTKADTWKRVCRDFSFFLGKR